MMHRLLVAMFIALITTFAAHGPALAANSLSGYSAPPPAPPGVVFAPQPGAMLPLRSAFTDDEGHSVRLAELFDGRPVVLVLGYYRCPNLCSTLMEGVLESLAAVALPKDTYRVVAVSIDPSEDAGVAARRKAAYGALVEQAGGDLHLLTGEAAPIASLVRSAGFAYRADPHSGQFAHAAGFIVATPDGHVARALMGVRFDPRDVTLALVDASSGRIGTIADRLTLLCAHYDPQTGRYTAPVMASVRGVCMVMLCALGWWLWRRHRRDGAS